MAVRKWERGLNDKFGTCSFTCTLNGGDTSLDLNIPDYSDKTVHVFGTFGSSSVSVKGTNSASGTTQDLHRVNDPSLTFTSLSSEVLALVLENPLTITASASAGSGAGLNVVVVGKRNM